MQTTEIRGRGWMSAAPSARSVSWAAFLCGLAASAVFAQAPPRQPTQPRAPTQDASDAQREFERGMAAFQGGDHAAALQRFAPLARAGHAAAQCMLGVMHQKGYAVPKNAAEGARWYTMSARGGDRDALFMLGQLYYRGEGVGKDAAKAADLFLLNAVAGDPDGQWAFGLCVCGGEGRPKDVVEGGAWLQLAARQGHREAQKELDALRLAPERAAEVRAAAQQLDTLVRTRGFDPRKLPQVPIPEGLSLDPNGPAAEPPAADAAPQEGAAALEAALDLAGRFTAVGDVRGTALVSFPPAFYSALKQHVPDARYFLRDLASGRADQEFAPDATAVYDDGLHAVRLTLHILGAARNLGEGRWEWTAKDHGLVELATLDDGGTVARFDLAHGAPSDDIVFRGQGAYRLPDGATDARWDAERGRLTYTLPPCDARGQGRLRVRFDVRDRIMGCLYKVYGLEEGFPGQWVGKALFSNEGDGVLTDLRVRFQLGDYSELDLWQKVPELVPGQTAVVVYRPVLRASTAALTSTTPANVFAEWRWTDSSGREREDSDGGRISILGRHEFVFSNLTERESTGSYYDLFSNAEFVAAWVTRDDPVVKQFAAAANKAAGGAGAPYSDEAAWKVLQACYELWLANDFTYQGPVGLSDPSLSFDNKTVQSMKFPRDVIRDRSGTCIELTALYCAMVHAVGLQSYMILVPGHAFPVVQLPSGKYLPVECTGIGGGKRGGVATFEQVVAAATKTYEKWATEGLVIEVDIDEAWLKGVANPELEALPADVLQRWGTVLEFTASGDGAPRPAQPLEPRATPEAEARAFVGNWTGTATQPLFGGQSLRWSFELTVAAAPNGALRADATGETRASNAWGGQDRYRFDEAFEGQVQRGELVMRGTRKVLTVNGQAQPIGTDTMTLRADAGRLVGEVALPDGTRVQVDVSRRP